MTSVAEETKSIGNILKEARLAKQWTLAKLSELTKIKSSNLAAMEEDRFEQIAAPTYARGFLKIAARILELNEAELLKIYEERYPQKSKQVLFLSENQIAHQPKSWPVLKKIFLPVAAGVLVLGVVFAAWKPNKNEVVLEPQAEVAPAEALPPAGRVPAAPIAEAPPVVNPATAPSLSVEIKAQAEVWVKVICDDKLVFENTLGKDREELWMAQEKLAVRIGRPRDVALRVNGKTVDLSRERKPVNLLVTQNEVNWND